MCTCKGRIKDEVVFVRQGRVVEMRCLYLPHIDYHAWPDRTLSSHDTWCQFFYFSTFQSRVCQVDDDIVRSLALVLTIGFSVCKNASKRHLSWRVFSALLLLSATTMLLDFNMIELSFLVLKAWFQRNYVRTCSNYRSFRDYLVQAIG